MDELSELAEEAARGDGDALHELVRRTQGSVWRFCRSLVDADAADDLAQETYLRALRGLPRFRGDASPLVWLLAVARNTCADELRRRTRERRAAGDPVRPPVLAADPSGYVELTELLRGLDEDRRTALVLTQVLGLSYAQTAQVCDVPVGTVRSRVARARSQLLRQLQAADTANAMGPALAGTVRRPRGSAALPPLVDGSEALL